MKWFKSLSENTRNLLILVVVIVGVIGGTSFASQKIGTDSSSSTAPKTSAPTVTPSPSIKVTTKTVYEEEPIAFTSSVIYDSNLEAGKTRTQTAGVSGVRTYAYEITYTNGIESSRKEVRNEITLQPVNEVIAHGTKSLAPSCPNGTYVNSYGNTVCSPSSSNVGGATARCIDGTYSYSQSRRGTCSHHGGVAVWL